VAHYRGELDTSMD